MKIKPGHYAHMRAAMALAQANNPTRTRAHYIATGIGKNPEKRHRWDLFYAAKLTPWICEHIYPYANDDHLDTAFKSIVKELEERQTAINMLTEIFR